MLMLSGNILKKTYTFKGEKNLHLGYFAHLAAMAVADQLGKDWRDVYLSQVRLVIGKKNYDDLETMFYEIPEVQGQIATLGQVTIHVVHSEVEDL